MLQKQQFPLVLVMPLTCVVSFYFDAFLQNNGPAGGGGGGGGLLRAAGRVHQADIISACHSVNGRSFSWQQAIP